MSHSLYLAASSVDDAVADVLQVYLEHAGMQCVRRDDVHVVLDFVDDLRITMRNCAAIIVIDSISFRHMGNNWELHFAQTLQKPLVVVSLDVPLDEVHSTRRVKLVNFMRPQQRDWHRLIDIIQNLIAGIT